MSASALRDHAEEGAALGLLVQGAHRRLDGRGVVALVVGVLPEPAAAVLVRTCSKTIHHFEIFHDFSIE